MKKKVSVLFLLFMVMAISIMVKPSFSKSRDDLYQELEIFAEGLAVVERKYVETKPAKDLMYGAMKGLLLSLDVYSQFLTPDDYKNLMVETEGKFGGLGIEITIREGVLTIISPIEDTPAWQAGIKAGDIVIKIDGELTKDITLNQAVKKMRGDPGTEITLTIFREEDRSVKDIEITRGIIKIQDIKRAIVLEDNIGYVKILEFRENTSRDLGKALKKMSKKKLKGLILDMRNNPGGLLSSAIEVSSRFLENGKVVVSTKSRNKSENIYKSISLREKYLNIPMVVLMNKGSASGSEIVAAALRDNNRAILMGVTTFGKGSVQTIIPLSDGAALRLTTSKYYTPSGGSIHEKGVKPDVVVEMRRITEKKEDVFKKIEKKKDFEYKDDYQIIRALDLIKALLVLSGAK